MQYRKQLIGFIAQLVAASSATLLWIILTVTPSALRGDIDCPATVPEHKLVVALLTTPIPDGAQIQGGWTAPTLDYRVVSGPQQSIHACGPPGKHEIAFRGVWVKTTPLTVDGQVVQVLEGFGFLDESATVQIMGDPGPDPPPPDPPGPNPPPVGPKQIMMFYDSDRLDNYPEPQRALLTSLALRKELVAAGHVVLEMVEAAALAGTPPARYKAFFDEARGKELPLLATAPKAGGTVTVVPLPADRAGLLEVLK